MGKLDSLQILGNRTHGHHRHHKQTAPNGRLDGKAKTTFAGKLAAQQHKCANIGGKKGSTVEEMGGRGLETVSRQTVATVPSSTQRCAAHYQC